MNNAPTDLREYDRYLSEANAELDAMLETGTPDPVPEPVVRDRGLFKVLVIGAVAVLVFLVGLILLKGRAPRRMAGALR